MGFKQDPHPSPLPRAGEGAPIASRETLTTHGQNPLSRMRERAGVRDFLSSIRADGAIR